MKWFENLTLVLRSSVTTLQEKIENPERMLHQLILDMEEEVQRVRDNVAHAIADEIQLGTRVDKARADAALWSERATAALRRGDEIAARSALDQKVRAEAQADTLGREHAGQKEQTAKLQRSLRDLEDKVRQARHKRTLLLARLTRAETTRKINDAMEGTCGTSAFVQFGRLEDQVERAEALSQSYDRLDGRDPEAEELKRQFEEKERQELLQREFEELKRRLQDEG